MSATSVLSGGPSNGEDIPEGRPWAGPQAASARMTAPAALPSFWGAHTPHGDPHRESVLSMHAQRPASAPAVLIVSGAAETCAVDAGRSTAAAAALARARRAIEDAMAIGHGAGSPCGREQAAAPQPPPPHHWPRRAGREQGSTVHAQSGRAGAGFQAECTGGVPEGGHGSGDGRASRSRAGGQEVRWAASENYTGRRCSSFRLRPAGEGAASSVERDDAVQNAEPGEMLPVGEALGCCIWALVQPVLVAQVSNNAAVSTC